MVTHDARAAAMADRVLFLADGLIVTELAALGPHEILAGDGGAERAVIRFALQGPARAEAAHRAHRARDRPRRRDGQRHVRADGLDRQARSTRSSTQLREHGRRRSPASRRSTSEATAAATDAVVRRDAARARSRRCRASQAAIGGVGGDAQLIGKDGKAIVFGGAPNLGFSVDPTQPQFNSLTL